MGSDEKNALGNDYAVTQITEAVVAHYAGATLQDLEDKFLDLLDEEEFADGWWSGEVISGTNMNLKELRIDPGDPASEAFSGIDDDGVWLVALFCRAQCRNPAPWSITVLKPCPSDSDGIPDGV